MHRLGFSITAGHVLAVVCILGGCTSQRAGSFTSLSQISTFTAAGPVTAADLMPLPGEPGRFEYIEGPLAGRAFDYELRADPPSGGWLQTLVGRHDVLLQQREDGALVIAWEIDHESKVRVVYEPALVLLPAQLAMNQVARGEVHMAVFNLSGKALRDQGSCQYQITVLGWAPVRTLSGTVQACFIQTVRRIDLGLADVAVTIRSAYVPQRGRVAQRVQRDTRVMGLITIRRVDEMRRGQ